MRAGHEPVRLVHGHHHRPEIIRLEHRLARLAFLDALAAAQNAEAAREILQLLALGGVDDADAFEREVQVRGDLFDLRAVAQQDGHAQPQGMELPGRLEHARLRAFRKDDPLGMPLQFFDDRSYETHGVK